MKFELPVITIPDHVPAGLVRPFPFIFGMVTDKDPFNELAASVHQGPDISYAPHAYPGLSPAWIVRRTEDLRKVYFDTEHFSSKDYAPFAALSGGNWSVIPTEIDPPQHQVYRALMGPLFAPVPMAKLEDRIRSYSREYILAFKGKGHCEFMKDFAFEFPIKVFLELMGLPQEQTRQFLEWEFGLLHTNDMTEMGQATRNVVAYLKEQIADRRANPGDDLISFAVGAEIDGRPMTEDELVGFTFNLFIGGLDTVSTNMGLHFLHLARHPGDQQQLREDPELIPAAIEEMMRAYPAVTTFRTCVKETILKGVTFMPGDKIAMSTTLVGRDPDEYSEPNEVRFDRKARHVSFGYGPHICLGLHLARREMRIAMEEFLREIPTFHLPEGHVVNYHMGMIQPVELPLQW